MTLALPQLQGLLLDLLSTRRSVTPEAIAALEAADWPILLSLARQHRLCPILHWRLTQERSELPIPATVLAELTGGWKKSALRALIMQRELESIHQILERAAIPHVALKGAFLAFHAYPRAALRPLRDLDILVPKETLLQAYQVLLDGGLRRMAHHHGDLAACSEVHKHLPPLSSPSGLVTVELHNRLFHPNRHGGAEDDLSDDPQLWQRLMRRESNGQSISFLSPTDLLLHLIIHAVYDHQLDNGPLLLNDIAWLLATHEIEWPLFWNLAQRYGRTRGGLLALHMAERYFGPLPIHWPEAGYRPAESLQAVLKEACLLTLGDAESRADVKLASSAHRPGGFLAKAGLFVHKAFPRRTALAAIYPTAADSPWIYRWYAVRWWQLATRRMPQYWRNRQDEQLAIDTGRLNQVKAWLQG